MNDIWVRIFKEKTETSIKIPCSVYLKRLRKTMKQLSTTLFENCISLVSRFVHLSVALYVNQTRQIRFLARVLYPSSFANSGAVLDDNPFTFSCFVSHLFIRGVAALCNITIHYATTIFT
jgi:hypothetical protein